MKHIINKIALVAVVVTTLLVSSCTNWLTVKPDDKVDQGDLLSTPAGALKALNGVYLSLAENNSYGREYTCATVDILGQMYSIDPMSQNPYRLHVQYNYTDKLVKNTFDAMWQISYLQIANLNNLILAIHDKSSLFDKDDDYVNYDYIMGESYALRAMLHFDLFRLWGPIYNAENANTLSLPYYTTIADQGNSFLPAKDFLASVVTDLKAAEAFLEKDLNSKEMFALTNRNMRMNVFAVKSLLARVYLYMGEKESAYNVVSSLIYEQGTYYNRMSDLFPFVQRSSIENSASADRVFFSELIFCINNSKRGTIYDELFSYQLNKDMFISADLDVINKLYSINTKDYRATLWKESPGGGKEIEFLKFQNITDDLFPQRTKVQSLVRLGELYLIAAETAPLESLRVAYLDRLRIARGYESGISSEEKDDWRTTILTEYKRELYGEGQYFFALKRLAIHSLTDGFTSAREINMGPAQYVIPIPDSEIKN